MSIIKITMLTLTFALMSFTEIPPQANPKENAATSTTASAILWKSESIDLGEIPVSKPKQIDYEFKNTGKTAVIITNVTGSCGCTATDYTKTPVQPGATAKVTATFNAAVKGAFSKTVTVTTNAETTPKVLTFKGTVI